jgi:hypothetical protein
MKEAIDYVNEECHTTKAGSTDNQALIQPYIRKNNAANFSILQ